jgi:hypothetical protein
VVLVNWQAHPDFSTYLGFNQIAADFVGPLRDELERLSGAQVAYFTGASGNVTPLSKVAEENKFKGIEWREYGTELGKLAYEGLAGLKPVEGSGIETRRRMVSVDIDRSWDYMLEQANEVYDLWKSAGDEAGAVLAKSYGFTSVFQARAIRDRTARGTTEELQANAFRVGGIGFASCTYEMFAQNGAAIKENSPYEITLVISSNSSYIPNDAAFEYRCYEADTGFYARGTAERMVDNFVEMLKEMQ